MSEEIFQQTASDLGRMIQSRKLSPLEITLEFLSEIDRHPLADRIYARTTPERAIEEAKAATDRAFQGNRKGLIDGVPVSWKDLFDTKEIATESGSAFLEGNIPNNDAEVLENATTEGLICLGKTHMSELAFSGLGMNPITQSPPCVNDLDAVSGGSSSGAAASIAFGLAAAAIGSDTGGSVRIPAAWNDLVGLKTTWGLLSLKGAIPLCSKFDTVGPLCRSVEDAANLLAILKKENRMQFAQSSLKGRRFAICTTLALDEMEDQPKRAFEDSVAALKSAGASIEELTIPEASAAVGLSGCIYTKEAYSQWRDDIETRSELMFSEIRDRFLLGKGYSDDDYANAWNQLDQLRLSYLDRTSKYDAVIMPSYPIMPPNLEKLSTDSEYYTRSNLLALRNTRIGNLLGLCSLTLPSKHASCGLMMCCNPMNEDHLLQIGSEIEPILT